MTEITGNRCGHDPAFLRHCKIVKHGRGGQPQVLGVISSYLQNAALHRNRLKSWQNMNDTGRGRRSEIREAMMAVMQYLFASDFKLDSRRCARRTEDGFHIAPDAKLIATDVSKSKAWKGKPALSEGRVRTILTEFRRCGYIQLSHQEKRHKATGDWESSPKVIQFTKRFFIELGGRKLWRSIAKLGTDRAERLLKKYRQLDEATASAMMRAYFTLNGIFTPNQYKNRPPDRRPIPLI
ncbi:hypothetical protein HBA55_34480 [Pseudomaricurvus alkylphenolicus]|uniref:hypothetical protein n=1 Tax=Pseudomaricurvus alkylphenolicus TaxID=1306991 RepID=UPI001421E8C4|nr:hypothetical protein [Pseudomaricurvus alkylphenolicus]NIB44738.1 hypothetical protein [Pseudomaricurvus alkylphenolicus]